MHEVPQGHRVPHDRGDQRQIAMGLPEDGLLGHRLSSGDALPSRNMAPRRSARDDRHVVVFLREVRGVEGLGGDDVYFHDGPTSAPNRRGNLREVRGEVRSEVRGEVRVVEFVVVVVVVLVANSDRPHS